MAAKLLIFSFLCKFYCKDLVIYRKKYIFARNFRTMNAIESFVYNHVKNNYIVKNILRNAYQGFYDLLPNYDSRFMKPVVVHENSFFGFHDSDPFSNDGKKSLAYRLSMPLRMPTKSDSLEIGYWTGNGFSDWVKVGDSLAWNYHKGCRLQWIDDNRCIFNTADGGTLCSQIIDVTSLEKTKINWPVDTVSYDSRYATTFSYERLQQQMPGYGYLYGDSDAYMSNRLSDKTGLFLVDIQHNSRKLLLSLETVAAFKHEASMDDTFHFVTHTEFSFDNRYIAFLHRWYKGTSRNTRLLVYDREKCQLFASPTTGMVSHYAWNHENGIVAYCRMEGVDSHVYFSSPQMLEWKRCAFPQLNSDGHQHFIDDDWFLVDTYPDKWRHCKLYKVNRKTDEVVLLADVKSPKQFVAPDQDHWWKCDLHPRCSADGKWASFDSVHTGLRSLCLMPLT